MNRVSRFLLPARQRAILDLIVRHYRVTGEACSANYLARRMDLHHSTVQEHISALHRKGWLRSANTPAIPTRFS